MKKKEKQERKKETKREKERKKTIPSSLLLACLLALRPSNMLVCLKDGNSSDKFTCCHIEIEVADQTFYLTQSHYTDTGPTTPSSDPTTPGRAAIGVPTFKSLV